jgi:hypothetical protein
VGDEHTHPQDVPVSGPEARLAALEARMDAADRREVDSAAKTPATVAGDFTHSGIELVGRHVPEEHDEVISAHEREKVLLPGTYEIGALIEGAFIPLARLKAAEVLEAIERAAKSAEQPDADTE